MSEKLCVHGVPLEWNCNACSDNGKGRITTNCQSCQKTINLVNKQIDDESLWHWPKSDLEISLQKALKELHGVIEDE